MPAWTRAALLHELAESVDAASAGTGRVVFLSGEAGIGKTTIVRALADGRGERVLWGSCEPLTTSRPLLPLHDWAGALGGETSAALASDDSRFDVFSAVLAELGRIPTLAVIEDVHWADDSTLDLIVFLGRRLAQLPVSLLLTSREDEPVSSRCAEVLALLGALPLAIRLSVPALTIAEVAAITAGSGLDAQHVQRITGGNAFFVTQLVGAPTEGVPRSVREAILARVRTLSDAGGVLVETVSVMPERADLSAVYAAAAAGPADLELAERAGLLVSDSRVVEFRHELAREAVEGALPGSRRRQRHKAVFEALLTRRRHDNHLLAYHADRAGQSEAAVEFGYRAARLSAAAGSHRQAAVQLERARTHLDFVPPGLALRVLDLLVEQYQLTGPLASAVARAEEALACARNIGDLDGVASALAQLARTEWMAGHRDEAQAALAEAERVAQQVPGTAGELAYLTQAARLSMLGRRLSAAVELGTRAIGLADALGERGSRLASVNSVGTAMLLDDPDGGQALITDGITLARRFGEDGHAALLMANLGSMSGEYRRYEVAIDWLQRCAEFCRDRDVDMTRDFALSWLARIAFERGDWTRAVELGTTLLDSPDVLSRMNVSTLLGRIAVHRSDRAATALLGNAWDLTERGGDTQRMWPAAAGLAEAAWADERADPPPQVLRVFGDAVELGMSWAIGELGWWLVRFGVLSGDDTRLAAAAAPYAAQIRSEWPIAARCWIELGCRLETAQALGETDDPDALRQAIASLDELGARAAADRVAGRLRSLGGVVRRARRTTTANPFQLTARELEVLELLRDGLTNAEIAQRTFTSAKTAGHHVSSILAKLGVRSRHDAVRAAEALEADEGPAGTRPAGQR